ncbi:hypothetical protein D3C75_603500 [compost metagenome]
MNAATLACAPSGTAWDGINWADVQRRVRGLQARIVKAVQDGRHNKAKALQWLLTHSFSGKALAVKRVSENKGKKYSRCGQGHLEYAQGQDRCDRVVEAARLLAASASESTHSEEKR